MSLAPQGNRLQRRLTRCAFRGRLALALGVAQAQPAARAARGANASRGAERGELWSWLERHAAILPQELDQLKAWYADAHAMRKLPLVSLQNLLDNLERRLKT